MKLLKLFSGRIFITSVLLLIQLAWFLVFIIRLTSYSVLISTVFSILSLLIILYIIGKDENASYRLAWIMLIMALPLFGGLLYLFFGNKRPSRSMRSRLDKEHKKILELLEMDDDLLAEIQSSNERAFGTIRYLQEKTFYPVYKNTSTKYYPVGERMYEDLLVALERAERFIFLEYFIVAEGLMWDGILDILTKKAAEGLDIRLIYDDLGSLFTLPGDFVRQMESRGIKCLAFNKFRPILSLAMNNRDHRKYTVIDGHIAFNGGINLADEYINAQEKYGHWKDTGVRLEGDAVWNFTLMFLEMWNAFCDTDDDFSRFHPEVCGRRYGEADGYVQPFSDSPIDDETTGENVYLELLAQAKRYVYIFTPYLVVDNEMKSALVMAAKRGVDVRLVTPGIPDKKIVYRLTRSNYSMLLEAGVRIYEYTPGFLHAKSCVCDDELAFVGTINMDYRSLYLHFECGTLMYNTNTVLDVKHDSLETMKLSREIRLEDRKNGFIGRLFDAILRLAAPIM